MIQSSAQSHAVEALRGGPGRSRPADLKAKRTGLAGLFSSLLAEARGRIEAGASKGAASKDAKATPGPKAESVSGKGAGLRSGATIGKGNGVGAALRTARTEAADPRAGGKVPGTDTPEAIEKNAVQALAGRQMAGAAAKKAGDAEIASRGSAEKERAELAKTRRLIGLHQGSEENAAAEQAAALAGRGGTASKVQLRKGEGVEVSADAKDVKKRDKRKERIDLQLYDHRSSSHQPSPDAVQAAVQKEDASSADRKSAASEADLVVHLRTGNAERSDDAPRPASAPASSFADALARELRENANADIVKHASLVLKDGGEGLLRLSLKPDSLGAVKIRLEMADNKIAGRILVESDEALKAFEKELRSLEQAFLDGGFDGASLELGVSSDGAGRGSEGRSGDGGPRPYFSERLATSSYDATALAADRPSASLSPDTLVNVLI